MSKRNPIKSREHTAEAGGRPGAGDGSDDERGGRDPGDRGGRDRGDPGDVAGIPEPRWQALVGALAAGGVYAGLPDNLSVGPSWLAPAAVGVLAIPLVVTHRAGRHSLNRAIGLTIEALLTLFLIGALVLLVRALLLHAEGPGPLLRSAASLWVTNVLVFALWYWRLDAGGPHGRDRRPGHKSGSFLFPQMTLEDHVHGATRERPWSPAFIDYLFLAFNTSTAFSPTDTAVLSRWAKCLTMLQAGISLSVVAILVGRAVNIL